MPPRRITPTSRLRVIAGSRRGMRLVAAPHVRPTTGRAREAIFSSLGTRVVDAVVLDLYAGSGALGIEALSRGATTAVLVDSDRAAIETCRANLATTKLTARVVTADVGRFVAGPPPPEAPFALVLCDPPYDTDDDGVVTVLAALAAPGWLAGDAIVVVERPARRRLHPEEGAGRWPPAFECVWERTYGDTLVMALEPSP